LTSARGVKYCSVCQQPFDPKMPSLGAAFRKHVLEVHRSVQETDGAKLTAPGVIAKKTK
jgi:hypothetical protein